MLVLNNIACADDWSDAATLGPLPSGVSVSYLVANESAIAQVYYSGQAQPSTQGDIRVTPEILLGPQQGRYAVAKGMRFRNAVAGQTARIIAVLSEPHDPIGDAQAFSGVLAASGSISPQPTVTLVRARMRNSINQAIPNGAGFTQVTFNTLEFDTAFFRTGSFYTCPVGSDGFYMVGCAAQFAASTGIGDDWRELVIRYTNGPSSIVAEARATVTATTTGFAGCETNLFLVGGATVEVLARHSAAAPINCLAANDSSPIFWLMGVN